MLGYITPRIAASEDFRFLERDCQRRSCLLFPVRSRKRLFPVPSPDLGLRRRGAGRVKDG